MTKKKQGEEKCRLLCEKEINESLSKVEKYVGEVIQVLEKEELNERDIILLKLVARVFVQKAILGKAESIALFGVDLQNASLCGRNPSCDDCELEVCDLLK